MEPESQAADYHADTPIELLLHEGLHGDKMIARKPSTDLCMSIAQREEVNPHKKIMVADPTTQGCCSSDFPNEEESNQNSSSDSTMMVLVSEPQRCNICLEHKDLKEMLTSLRKHTQSELKDGSISRCPQPECRREMEVEQCGQFLPTEFLELFSRLLTEASIPENERIYCPYPDCSKLFLKNPSQSSSEEIMVCNRVTCVTCKRSFCLSCKVPSHAPLSCEEFEELPPEEKQKHDLKLLELSALCEWKRCGGCHMLIEKTEGCSHMRCSYALVIFLVASLFLGDGLPDALLLVL